MTTLIIVLLVLWLLGFLGNVGGKRGPSAIHDGPRRMRG
jgi:hypothetical protein